MSVDLGGIDGSEVRVAIDDGEFGDWRPFDTKLGVQLGGPQGERGIRVQPRSFRGVVGPVFRDSIVLDSEPPVLEGPTVSLTQGGRLPQSGRKAPASVSMSADDVTSGVASAQLSASCSDAAGTARIGEAGALDLPLSIARRACRIDGQARDLAGHRKSRSLDPSIRYRDLRRGSSTQRFRGSWSTDSASAAIDGSLVSTSSKGAFVRLDVRGAQFAIVARRGPAGGLLSVLVDGEDVGSVDLYAPTAEYRRVVFVRNISKGEHELKLVAAGEGSAESSGSAGRARRRRLARPPSLRSGRRQPSLRSARSARPVARPGVGASHQGRPGPHRGRSSR